MFKGKGEDLGRALGDLESSEHTSSPHVPQHMNHEIHHEAKHAFKKVDIISIDTLNLTCPRVPRPSRPFIDGLLAHLEPMFGAKVPSKVVCTTKDILAGS